MTIHGSKDIQSVHAALQGLPARQSVISINKDLIKIKKPLYKNDCGILHCVQKIIPGHRTPEHLKKRLNKEPVLFIINDKTTIKIMGGIISITNVQVIISLEKEGYRYLSIGSRLNEGDDDVVCNRIYPFNSPYGEKITACINFFKGAE